MFRSIRWRLVASYVLLTLLTVSLVGVLALSLIERYVERQELESLTENAEAVARKALPLMQSMAQRSSLQELAHTASFLGNVQARILDDHHDVLADSGQHAEGYEFVWIVTPVEVSIHASNGTDGGSFMVLSTGRHQVARMLEGGPAGIFEHLPPGTEYTVVRRVTSPWGSRFIFSPGQETGVPPLPDLVVEEEMAELHSERAVSVPIGEMDEPLGYVELSKGPDFGAEALATARRAFVLAGGGATLLALIVGLLVSRGLTAPLRNLSAVASLMSGGDLSIRAPVRGKDEIGQLARQFNHMAERLEASFGELAAERDSLRRFIADASHELRTPITALKNFNELLQNGAADDPPARDEFLAESQAQLERLEWITHNLLDLSRIDAGLVALDLAEHDAGELIEAAAAAFKTLAQEKGIALSINLPPSALAVHCDRARVELALSNLLDNGLKFTPPGGRVGIGAEGGDERVRLWVQDSGPGIALGDQPHIFERFYQGQGGQAEGSGLGLAIVRSIAQAHGGRVAVESEPGAGSRFVIELPLAGSGE